MLGLVIIDFQQTIAEDGPAAHRWAACKDILKTAAMRARLRGIPVIFVRHSEPDGPWQRGTSGWNFFDDLKPEASEAIVEKSSCDSFRNTDLDQRLRAHGIDRIVVGGYATEFCIDTTVRAAASRGYSVHVLSDGHTTRDRPHLPATSIIAHHNWVWENMANPGNPIRVASADGWGD